MSAFLCTPEHVGALAQFAAEQRLTVWGISERTAEHFADLLALANLKSLAARYPDTSGAADWQTDLADDADYIKRCRSEARRLLYSRRPRGMFAGPGGMVNVYQLAACFRYQSCEADTWDSSPAARLIDAIQAKAVRAALSDEFERAVWAYQEPAA